MRRNSASGPGLLGLGDGDEGLFQAESGDFELARVEAEAVDGVHGRVGVVRLDTDAVAGDVERGEERQGAQGLFVDHALELEGDTAGPGTCLDLGGGAVGEDPALV